MKKSILCLASIICAFGSSAQIVNIPDPTFKAALVNSSVNTNQDTEIQVSEANSYTGLLQLVNQFTIADLTGIEEFTQITELNCAVNQITNLDLSNNLQLTSVIAYGNLINNVDFGTNTNIEYLNINANELISLDVSAQINMNFVSCSLNPLTSLNVANGNNTNMTFSATSTPNLQCVQVDDPVYSTANWSIDPGVTFSLDCSGTTSIDELSTESKQLVAIIDLMGRKTEFKPNVPLIFIYSDGTRERMMKLDYKN